MRTRVLRVLPFLLLPALAVAQNLAEFEKRVTEFKLGNGMKFLVLERHQAPVVSFNMFVKAGSVDDPEGKANLAHMFEHMISKGTRAVGTTDWGKERAALDQVEAAYERLELARTGKSADPAKIKELEADLKKAVEAANTFVEPNAYPRIIEESGGVGFNAGTGEDSTTYFYSLPSNRMELWFLMQSEWLRRPVLREFYKERDVVREERRMRVESSIFGRMLDKLLRTAFTAHPYKNWSSSPEEIDNLRVKDAEQFFRTYYVPSNIVVGIVGDVSTAAVRKMAERYFGSIPPGPKPPEVKVAEPKQTAERRAAVPAETQPILLIGYKRPTMYDPADPVLDVIAGILSSGRTGWLYQELVRDKRISLQAGADTSLPGGRYPSLFLLYSVPSVGHTIEENEKAIYDQLERLKNSPVEEETIQRVKTKVRAGLIRRLDSNMGLASQLSTYEAMYGDWRKMFTAIEEVRKVTASDIQRVAREYFVPAGRTVVYTETKKASPKGEAK